MSWIRSVHGEYAVVDDAEQVAVWTRVRGWSLADPPGPTDQVFAHHPDVVNPGRLPYEALTGGWADLGWVAGPPPEPVDLTRDVVAAPVAAAPTKAAASGSKSKE